MEATLLEKWIDKEKRVASLLKRRYLHFDRFIDFEKNQKKIIRELSNVKLIEEHSFYPFIKTTVETPRYKPRTDENGQKTRVLESKLRPIAYASHFDALIYSWYSTILTKAYEDQLDSWKIRDCVLAYLATGKSNIDYSFEIFNYISHLPQCAAIGIDVSSFFDNLDHEILKGMWAKTLKESKLPADHFNIYKSLTSYSTVPKFTLDDIFAYKLPNNRYCSPDEFRKYVRQGKLIEKNANLNLIPTSSRYKKQCGIPQGSPISSVLSNIYMIDFDMKMNKLAKNNTAVYRRYCDDIIVICEIDKVQLFQNELLGLALRNELTINPSKTEITYFTKTTNKLRGYKESSFTNFRNLQYLGFEFNGENIYIRASSISRYKRRIASEIRECLKAANGNNSISNIVFKKKLLKRFSSKGKRNFISYAIRAANNIMNSQSIKKQYNNSIDNVLNTFKYKQAKFNQKLIGKKKQPKAHK